MSIKLWSYVKTDVATASIQRWFNVKTLNIIAESMVFQHYTTLFQGLTSQQEHDVETTSIQRQLTRRRKTKFPTVKPPIYLPKWQIWMQLSPFKCIYSFFFCWKNVMFAQTDKCCELHKTKCQPMRSDITWWRRISDSISQNNNVGFLTLSNKTSHYIRKCIRI